MAATMVLGVVGKDGLAQIKVRVQDFKTKLQIKQGTGLYINESIWAKRNDEKARDKFLKHDDIRRTLETADEIRRTVNSIFEERGTITKEELRELIQSIVYREEIEQQRQEKEEAERLAAEKAKITLVQFIDRYVTEIKSGARQTEKGTNFSPNTVRSVKQALVQFQRFCKYKKTEYNFGDIDMQFYHDFTSYLKTEIKDRKGNVLKEAYNVNTTGKCIRTLKNILSIAESEGLHSNSIWKDKKFKGTRIETDSIYLTREDLDKIMKADLSKYGVGHDHARDIFMVGVWTAQRVSDYNYISKEQIYTHTKRWIEDVPDPENPGKTKAEIRTKEIMYISLIQKKTGAQVSIPVSSELKGILEKYDYSLPHLEDQVINRYLKDICKEAGLTESVEILETKGGTPVRNRYPKWDLVHTHTARRTGATLMYLSGMDLYDIMKITGHTTPVMLKKYIKADKLDIIEKITDKYNYFD